MLGLTCPQLKQKPAGICCLWLCCQTPWKRKKFQGKPLTLAHIIVPLVCKLFYFSRGKRDVREENEAQSFISMMRYPYNAMHLLDPA